MAKPGSGPMPTGYKCFMEGLPHARYCSSQCWETALNRTGRRILDLRGYTLIGGANAQKLHHEHHDWKQSMMEPGEWLQVGGDCFTLGGYGGLSEEAFDIEKNPKWRGGVSHFSAWGKCSQHQVQRPWGHTGLLYSGVGKTTSEAGNKWKRRR